MIWIANFCLALTLGCAVLAADAQVNSVNPENQTGNTQIDIQTASIVDSNATVSPSKLAAMLPDGGDLLTFYRAAQTVHDIELANARAEIETEASEEAAAKMATFHRLAMECAIRSPDDMNGLNGIVQKAIALRAILDSVDPEMKKSLDSFMRTTATGERSTATFAAQDDAARYQLAYQKLKQLRVRDDEAAQNIRNFVAINLPTTLRACSSFTIPPLFGGGDSTHNASDRRPATGSTTQSH